MPFIDVLAHEALLADPPRVCEDLTEAIVSAWAIPREITTVFLTPVAAPHYSHAGRVDNDPALRRVFIKLHGFPRAADQKRAVATAFADVFGARGVARDNVITYFLDRPADEVAHGGTLASDAPED